jgi:hypothetical protein
MFHVAYTCESSNHKYHLLFFLLTGCSLAGLVGVFNVLGGSSKSSPVSIASKKWECR